MEKWELTLYRHGSVHTRSAPFFAISMMERIKGEAMLPEKVAKNSISKRRGSVVNLIKRCSA